MTASNRNVQEIPAYFFEELELEVMARAGKKEGNEIRFLCPEHDDHNPSATYNPSKHLWHCFSCGASGGYISLAKLLGIELPSTLANKTWSEVETYKEDKAKRAEQRLIAQERIRAEKEAELKAQRERFINADNDYKTAQKELESPYCRHKEIYTFEGVHYHAKSRSTLLPIINMDSEVIAYQKIYRELETRFAKVTCGPSKGGLFFIDQEELKTELPEDIFGTLLFCEGFSTGASLHLATDYPVICTISANAMGTIVEDAIEKFCTHGNFNGIICADNDANKETNIGLKVGRTAAYKFQIRVCFPESEKESIDFNDVHAAHGLEEVKRIVMDSERITRNPNRLKPGDKGFKTYRERQYASLRGWS